ncbi:zinc-binding alcohol dehydrogenase family protein [Chryseobacterium luquanense]|uniref:Zinc-binding alcohol dehydrogenase family protein n=1 Tax=Chryseobacterium luquanense TaxID=2983766 RepID=A0ABT3Y7J3_9FLAO|nr:zinc-binding alcohol dehydrogenase family protein [Chryseobacterium luquanense]MCX8534132.1 zinc-binding alcohol dehydrogenase family protein [Chryseobacterium luquanense]
MKAAVLYRAGGPENLRLEKREIPLPKQDQVLIKIKAFGLNRSEIMTRKGYSESVHFPRILGIECVGEVVEDPSGEFRKGQKVAAFMGGMGRDFDGSYAEFAVLPKSIISSFESDLPWEILGALPEMLQTVYGSLHSALKINKGETLLIRGGTSSIGLLAAELAKSEGLKVISTTRNIDKQNLLIENGADRVLIDDGNLSNQISKQNIKIDKILELVGTSTLKDSLASVVQGGIVCMTGMLSEQWSIKDFAPMDFIQAASYLTIYDSGKIRVDGQYFQEFIRKVEAKEIKPVIKKIFKLEEIAEAQSFMESNQSGGKIVVLV